LNTSLALGIICAALVVVLVLLIVGIAASQSMAHRKSSPSSMSEENAEAPVPTVEAQAPQAVQVTAAQAIPIAVKPPDQDEYKKTLLSKDIVSHLKELPTVQAEVEKDTYRGNKVEWKLYFSSQMLKGQDQIEVFLLNENGTFPTVSFVVGLTDYPPLMKAQQGMPVVVRGEIASIYSMSIILRNVKLSFPDALSN